MLNNTFENNLHRSKSGNSGNFIALDITIKGKGITRINIYCPNNNNPHFFLNIIKCIEKKLNYQYVIRGNFNLVLNQDLQTKNYLHINHPKVHKTILEFTETFDMKDPFRELYPVLK